MPRHALWLWLLVAAACAGHAAPRKVVAVDVTGNEMVPRETILAAFSDVAQVGKEVSNPRLVAGVIKQKVEQLGYFRLVEVTPTETEGGVRFSIVVRERPRVAKVEFRGNTLISAEELSKDLRTRPGRLLDERLVDRDADMVMEAYRNRGRLASIQDVTLDDQGVVTFIIVEVGVSRVDFAGLQYVQPEDVQPLVTIKADSLYDEAQVRETARRLQETGWFSSAELQVRPDPERDSDRVVVTYVVTERPGILLDRIGPPAERPDPAAVRAVVGPPRVTVRYQAQFAVREELLDLQEEPEQARARLAPLVTANQATADQLYEYARVLTALGLTTEARVQYEAAAAAYRAALQAQPGDPRIATRLARCLEATEAHAEAVATLRAAIAASGDAWEPRAELAVAVRGLLATEVSKAQSGTAARSDWESRALQAVAGLAALVPWERTRLALLEALEATAENSDLMALGQEGQKALAEARRMAPRESAVARAEAGVVSTALLFAATSLPVATMIWEAAETEAQEWVQQLGDLVERDPVVALQAAFLVPFCTATKLSTRGRYGTHREQIAAQMGALATRLSEIARKWPRTVRDAGNLLGLAQSLAGEYEQARVTFEEAVKREPQNRRHYDALLAIAFERGDWREMERVLRLRLAANPAVEDYIMLGKVAEKLGRGGEALQHYHQATVAFPQEARGYFAVAGWLLHLGTDDNQALAMLEKGFALESQNAYGLAVRCAALLIGGKLQEAVVALQQALAVDPTEDLANSLRARFFSVKR